METLSSTPASWKNYLALVKPGIIMGNGITAISGFALASKGRYDGMLFLSMFFGLSLIIASGCAFNNYIDRKADQKMPRTQNRPLAQGAISIPKANFFAATLGILGVFLLGAYVNLLTAAIAVIGFAVYVLFYSFLKYHTHHATLIGSIAGAVPPVVGYTAVTHQMDPAAWILFAIIAFWQMPHFFAIAIYRLQDYAAASLPVLPLQKGIPATKIQMLLYTLAFTGSCCLLPLFGYASNTYLVASLVLGTAWTLLCIQGFKKGNDQAWARKMFFFSLIAVTTLSVLTPFCTKL